MELLSKYEIITFFNVYEKCTKFNFLLKECGTLLVVQLVEALRYK